MNANTPRYKSEEEYRLEKEALREQHQRWRKWLMGRRGFVQIYYDEFLEIVRRENVSGNAVRLYLFLAKHADWETGELRVSVQRIEGFFDCSKRTVLNWLKELEEAKLIKRIQAAPNRFAFTYLLPYHDEFFEHEKHKAAMLDRD
ncbi:MAG TPA: helix-turn-helix domain-containing protein [Bacilli bacterium]|nr:helix-turn-helix domain-containing protein [Bacilli bacterium]